MRHRRLRPFFPFYGMKWQAARHYPAPVGPLTEPFTGAAGYATYHNPERVTLMDVDPIIVGVWSYLTRATPAELLALPDLDAGQSAADLPVPQEARWLIGFWLNRGSAQPKLTGADYSTRTEAAQLTWGPKARARLAAQVEAIRHWSVLERSYEYAPREHGTWFVDPPYIDKGRYYRFSDVDFPHLARWSRALPGRVIVCEQAGAAWLPFEPLADVRSTRGTSREVCFLRENETDLGSPEHRMTMAEVAARTDARQLPTLLPPTHRAQRGLPGLR